MNAHAIYARKVEKIRRAQRRCIPIGKAAHRRKFMSRIRAVDKAFHKLINSTKK